MGQATKTATHLEYFPALTGIRALAMYMVFFQHFHYMLLDKDSMWTSAYFTELFIGLTIFFVLSGFLITYRYHIGRSRGFARYALNRVARVYPMYFLVTTVTFLIAGTQANYLAQGMSAAQAYIYNITFLRGFFHDLLFSGVAQGWSLTPEEVFYFTAPLSFMLLRRSAAFLVLIPIACFLIGLALVEAFGGGDNHGFMRDVPFMMSYTYFGLASTFFAGVALAIFFARYKQRFSTRFMTTIGALITIAVVLIGGAFKGDAMFSIEYTWGIALHGFLLPYVGLTTLLWGLMTETTWLSRLLSWMPVEMLGESSLTFYLIHMGVLSTLINSYFDSFAALILLITGIAFILYRFIERPADRWVRGLSKK